LAIVPDLGVLLESTGVRLAAEARRKHTALLVSEIFFSSLLLVESLIVVVGYIGIPVADR
jgi:hypothetical protein